MKTEFIDIIKKLGLQAKIKNGDEEALNILINELDRLESIIRDYEIALEVASNKLNNNIFKKPII